MNDIQSMAFYGRDGFHQAYAHAAAFAGEGGRVATLPDVIDARIADPGGEGAAWGVYLTTMTSEFVGRTKGGVPVLAVLHGTGPMSDREGVAAAYAHEYRSKDRSRDGGRIPVSAFHEILERDDVHVVDLAAAVAHGDWPFSFLTVEQSLGDPVLEARFGGRDRLERYVAVHGALAKTHWEEQTHFASDGGHGPLIVSNRDSNRCSYWRLDDIRNRSAARPHVPDEGGTAYAHLLSIGQLVQSSGGGTPGTSLQTEVSVHDWTDGTRFLALRAGALPGGFRLAVEHRDAVKDPLLREVLWRDAAGPTRDARGFHALMRVGEEWYSRAPKVGVATDSADPDHAVRSIARIGEDATLTVETAGYYGFFAYGIADVQRIAPRHANAYTLIGTPDVIDGGARQACKVRFYRAELDRSRRLLSRDELARDYRTTVDLVAMAGGEAASRIPSFADYLADGDAA